MNATGDRLDDAIEQVAKRLIRVAEDDALAARIANALPERSPIRWWAPRLAITTGLAIGALFSVLRPFDGRSTGVLRTESSSAPFVEFRAAIQRTSVEPELIVRRSTVERSSNDRRTTADFDRSLAAIASPLPLALGAVEPSDLPGQSPLIVAPLAIADLPLTAENNVPR